MESKLQIISGRFRGRKLHLPTGARPTQNRARIALFNMLESGLFDFNREFTVWDAFAGSGAFGMECASRYPGASVIFTDVAPESARTVQKNAALLGLGPSVRIFQVDALSVVKKYGAISDLVFVDAPYELHNDAAAFMRKLGTVAPAGTVAVWEQDGATPHAPTDDWKILRDKKYGRARFLILMHK